MSYGASAFPPVWINIIGYDKPQRIRPYEKRMNADELALSLRETISRGLVLYMPFVRFISHRPDTITKVFDRSPFGNHGTIHGAVWQTLPSGKSALSFDGVDDCIDCGSDESLNITDAITVEAWVNLRKKSGYYGIASKELSWNFEWYNDGWKSEFYIDGNWRSADWFTFTNYFGKWVHLALTYDSETHLIKKYINGNLVQTTELIGLTDYKIGSSTYSVRIGRNVHHGAGYADGTIDEVRIYNRALSKDEIRRLYELTRVFYGV